MSFFWRYISFSWHFYFIILYFILNSAEDFFERFVILSTILLPIKSTLASAVFWIALFEAVFIASVVDFLALLRRFWLYLLLKCFLIFLAKDKNSYRFTYPAARNVPGTSAEGPLKFLTSGNPRGPLGDSKGSNKKIDDLMKKMIFRCNSLCFTHLYLFFTGKTNIQKLWIGTSSRRLQDLVAGRPGDQMMGRSGDIRGTLVIYVF